MPPPRGRSRRPAPSPRLRPPRSSWRPPGPGSPPCPTRRPAGGRRRRPARGRPHRMRSAHPSRPGSRATAPPGRGLWAATSSADGPRAAGGRHGRGPVGGGDAREGAPDDRVDSTSRGAPVLLGRLQRVRPAAPPPWPVRGRTSPLAPSVVRCVAAARPPAMRSDPLCPALPRCPDPRATATVAAPPDRLLAPPPLRAPARPAGSPGPAPAAAAPPVAAPARRGRSRS